jgi:hypothetical protein
MVAGARCGRANAARSASVIVSRPLWLRPAPCPDSGPASITAFPCPDIDSATAAEPQTPNNSPRAIWRLSPSRPVGFALFKKRRQPLPPVWCAEDVAQGFDLIFHVSPVIKVVCTHERLAAERHDGR